MGGFQEEPGFICFKCILYQCLIAAGTVRVEQIAVVFIYVSDCILDIFVGEAVAVDPLAYLLMFITVAVEQIHDTGKVAWIAYIHCVGDGGNGRTRRINTRIQIFQEYVVAIIGCDEVLDRQSHPTGEKAGGDISEVTAGDGDHQVVGLTYLVQLGIRIEVIERLRKETGYVDGVGRGQFHVTVQFFVHESRFNQRLAIIEGAVYFQSGNVLSQCRELAFLDRAYFSFRVKHIYMDARFAQEAVGYGA